jgi:hypothetical protein
MAHAYARRLHREAAIVWTNDDRKVLSYAW